MFIIKFFGGIIGGILQRIIIMALMVGGGAYFVQSQGGIGGVMALATGQPAPEGTGEGGGLALPSVAGLGGFSAMLDKVRGKTAEPEYYDQQARISAVTVQCRLSLKQGGKLNQTQPLDCHRARAALSDPQFAGYEMKKSQTATYIYYAMDGVNVHTGTMSLKQRRNIGDVIRIRVNRLDPRQSTPI